MIIYNLTLFRVTNPSFFIKVNENTVMYDV